MATKNHKRTAVTGKPVKRMSKAQMGETKGGIIAVLIGLRAAAVNVQ